MSMKLNSGDTMELVLLIKPLLRGLRLNQFKNSKN